MRQIYGTWTEDGLIPHLEWCKIALPVALDFSQPARKVHGAPRPKTKNGYLVFVLPGGREHVSHIRHDAR